MKRAGRLASARSSWLKKFEGKNIVAGYRKHFGVAWMCAFTFRFISHFRIGWSWETSYRSASGHKYADLTARKFFTTINV